MGPFEDKHCGDPSMKIVLLVSALAALMTPAVPSLAQTALETAIPTMTQRAFQPIGPRLLCGQDARTFVERRVAGKTLLVCADGAMSELLSIGGQTVIAEVRVTGPDEAAQLREDELYRRQHRSYGGDYRSFPPGRRCVGNVSVIADYYTAYCRDQRNRYNALASDQHSPCYGDNAHRYADECARQRNGTYGRRY